MGEKFERYPESDHVWTPLDPTTDVLDWVKGLRSPAVLTSAASGHLCFGTLSRSERDRRAIAASAHVSAAVDYLTQSHNGPENISFLPIYYALLNLAKVYVILGPLEHRLNKERSHGVSFDFTQSNMNFLDDHLKLYPSGAIALFYETMTSKILPNVLEVEDLYRYIWCINYEFHNVVGKETPSNRFEIRIDHRNPQRCRIVARRESNYSVPNGWRYMALSGLRRLPGSTDEWASRFVPYTRNDDQVALLRPLLRCHMIRGANDPNSSETISNVHLSASHAKWEPFTELTTLLAFYHLGMIARYHPEYLLKLQSSLYWPLILNLRRHALFYFLLDFYSFIHQKTVYVHGES